MRLFLSCSLFLFLLACGTPFQIPKKYQKEQINQEVKNPYFSGSEEHFYRATIEAYGHTFNGILAIKTNSLSHRVALTTDFGNTLLDFSYTEKKWKVNYINEDLDRKPLIGMFERDFLDLLKSFHCTEKYSDSQKVIYLSQEQKTKNYLFQNPSGKIYEQVNTNGSKKYTTFAFFYNGEGQLREVLIEHHTMKVLITLSLM